MARIVKSPIGELSGKAGGLVFKTGKNGNYVSSLPVHTNKKPSPVQQLQRDKMTVVMEFMRPFQWAFREYYFPFQQNKSGFHAAKSYHLKEALKFEDGIYSIHYPKTQLTYGDLRIIENLEVEADAVNKSLKFKWKDNSDQSMAYPEDALLLLFYSEKSKSRFFYLQEARRSDGVLEYNVKSSNGDAYHVWASFYQADMQRASPSVYAGCFVI